MLQCSPQKAKKTKKKKKKEISSHNNIVLDFYSITHSRSSITFTHKLLVSTWAGRTSTVCGFKVALQLALLFS